MKIWQRVLGVVLSAVLASLVFAPVAASWLSVVAWIPLLFALRGASIRAAAWLAFGHGVLFYGSTMSWIVEVFGSWQMLPPLVVIMALFSLFFGLGYALAWQRGLRGGRLALFAGLWWLALEFVRSEIYVLQFPWMTPGVGLGPSLLSPLFGVYAMSFLLITCGACCLEKGRLRLGGGIGLLLVSALVLCRPQAELGENTVKVLAVQEESLLSEELLAVSREAAAEVEGLDAVLFPEYAITYDVRKNAFIWKELLSFAKEFDAVVVLGTQTDLSEDTYYNTALTFDHTGALGEHYKNHTVHFFADGKKGTTAEAVSTPIGTFGTPICFDSDYEDVVRKMTVDGAEYFLIPSLDATRWGVKEHLQHADLFLHRAAENGRWMLVCAGSGVTQLIDPYGNRVAQIPIMQSGTLVAELEPLSTLTFYTRYGWLFAWIGMSGGGVWFLGLVCQTIYKTWQKKGSVSQATKLAIMQAQ